MAFFEIIKTLARVLASSTRIPCVGLAVGAVLVKLQHIKHNRGSSYLSIFAAIKNKSSSSIHISENNMDFL